MGRALKPLALICEPLSSRLRVDLTKYGDGTAVGYVTLQVAHLESLLGESGLKPISHSSKEEITDVGLPCYENIPGGERIFAGSAIHSVHIPGFIPGEGTPEKPRRSDEEMFSPGPSCRQKQRQAFTSVPNLMLAGTSVRTTLGSENMDSANESGKHAIGQASGLPVPPVPIGTLRYTALLRRLHAVDDRRFEAGKRNIFDAFFPQRPAEVPSTKPIHVSQPLRPRTTLLNGPTVARALPRPGAIGPKLSTTM
jgi:hypothetical protein